MEHRTVLYFIGAGVCFVIALLLVFRSRNSRTRIITEYSTTSAQIIPVPQTQSYVIQTTGQVVYPRANHVTTYQVM